MTDDQHRTDNRGRADDAGRDEPGGSTEDSRMHWKEAAGRYVNRPGLSDNTRRTLRSTLGTFFQDYVSMFTESPAGVEPREVKAFVERNSISESYRLSLYSRLNAFYTWLVDEGHIEEDENPVEAVERPEAPSVERPYLPPDAFTRLTSIIRADYEERSGLRGRHGIQDNEIIWILAPLKFATATGLRPSALQDLRVGDVNFEEETLDVPALKSEAGIDRTVPLCPLALEVAKEAKTGKVETDFLFSGARSERFDTRRLSRTVKRYALKAGLGDEMKFTACTRHTCASWLTILGYPAKDVAKMLGYTSLKSTEPYQHLAPTLEELRGEIHTDLTIFAEKTTEIGFFPPVF